MKHYEIQYELSRRRFLQSGAGAMALGFVAPGIVRAQDGTLIRISDTTAMHEMVIYGIADTIQRGYSVDFLNLGASGTSMLAALLNSMCDSISSANSYLVTAVSQGANITPICGLAGRGQAIVAREASGIKTLEDLRGKKLTTKPMTSAHVMMQVALKAVGINPRKDVEIVDFGQPAGFTLMLEGGQADAGQVWEPFASIAASKPGLFKLELNRFFDLTWKTHSSLYVPQTLIEKKPETVRALVAANVAAIEAMKNDRAKFSKIVTNRVGQPPAILDDAMDNCELRPEMDATVFYKIAEEMASLGMVDKDYAPVLESKINYTFLSEITGRTPEQLGFVSYSDYKDGKRPSLGR
jgi:NitT/TauT family transport system substrate-binding protein